MNNRTLKAIVFVVCAIPLALLGYDAAAHNLGANPVDEVLNRLGSTSIMFLMASLVPTPLKILFNFKKPLQVRRMLGLWAFTYVVLHFLTYAIADQGFDFGDIWKDVVKHWFVFFGFAAFLLLIPVAITSTEKMVQRLGFRKWKAIHRLVYVAAALAVVHYWFRVKADPIEPALWGIFLAILLGVRVVDVIRKRAQA